MTKPRIRLVPLGGLGEIGMNCLAVESDDSIVVVDCGVMFPDRDLGVDVIHPDFSYLLENRDRVKGVVITHGHEDHIGGVPYLLRQLDVPVHGPPYALALIRERLREHELDADLRPTKPRDWFRVGDIEVEPLRVTHSIVDSTALVLRTPGGTVLHTGDFKFDPRPIDGEQFDVERLAQLGRDGIDVLLSDSTNADVPGTAGSEATVADALTRLVAGAKARIVVAAFASNIHRIRALIEAARACGRYVCLLGRSMQNHVRIATDERYLPDPSPWLVSPDRAQTLPREQLLVLATGTQGEPAAALARLAEDTHPALRLEEGDEVLLSSRVIPGSETDVHALICNLERRGIIVRFRATDPQIHVSGHACRDEQRRMIELAQPRAFVPIHGTYHHLRRHASLADECGVSQTIVVENGAMVDVDASAMWVAGHAPIGRVHVDAGEEIAEGVLRDRALLAELGVAVVVVLLDARGRLAREPHVMTRGVIDDTQEPQLLAAARRYVAESFASHRTPLLQADESELRDLAERALRRFFARKLNRKPMTYGVVVQVPR